MEKSTSASLGDLSPLCEDALLEILSYLSLGDILTLQTVSRSVFAVANLDQTCQSLCLQRWRFLGSVGIALQDLSKDCGGWKLCLRHLQSFRIADIMCNTNGYRSGFLSYWRITPVFPGSMESQEDDYEVEPAYIPRMSSFADAERHIVQHAIQIRGGSYMPCPVWAKNVYRLPESSCRRGTNVHGFALRFNVWDYQDLNGQAFGLLGLQSDGDVIDILHRKPWIMSFDQPEENGPRFSFWGIDLVRGTKLRDGEVEEWPCLQRPYATEVDDSLMNRIRGRCIVLSCVFDLDAKTISFSIDGVDLGVAFDDVEGVSFVPVIYLFDRDYYELLCQF